MDRLERLRLVANVGRWRVLGVGLVVGLLLPVELLFFAVTTIIMIDVLLVSRRVGQAREFLPEFEGVSDEAFREMARRARRRWRGSLHARLVDAGASMLLESRGRSCHEGHALGCAHRPVSWPASVELAASARQ